MTVQFITGPAGERLVVLPVADYERLVEALEDASDVAAVEVFRRKLAAGEEELLPAEMVHRIVAGENAIKVWRKHRGLTAQALADQVELSRAFVTQIEGGHRQGGIDALKRIAAVLRVTVDELI